jgi:thioredoxin 1
MLKRSIFITVAIALLSMTCIAAVKHTKDIKDIKSAFKSGVPVVVKLGTDWCPPCQKMKPILEALSKEQDGKAIFLVINIDKDRELAGKYKVRLIPTILFFDKRGSLKLRTEGFMSKEELLNKIKELKLNK